MKARSNGRRASSRLVEVVARVIEIAPTTPMAYRPASFSTLGKRTTTTAGTTAATTSGILGIPYRFRLPNARGSSLSRESMNWVDTRAPMAVLTAESRSRAKTTAATAAKPGLT